MIEAKLREDLKTAMRAKEAERVMTLRSLISVIQNEKINLTKDRAEELDEKDEQKVLKTELKKRNEAAAVYEQAGRADSANAERQEAEIIKSYLPAQLSDEDLTKIIGEVIKEKGSDNFGVVIKETLTRAKGQADGNRVKQIFDTILNK